MFAFVRHIIAWYAHVPPDIPRGEARIYIGAKLGYTAGVILHSFMVPVFFHLDQLVLGYYNIGSTVISVAAFVLHVRGRPAPAFIIITTEVTVATVLATIYMGLEPGFFLFMLIGALYTPLAAFLTLRMRGTIMLVMTVGFVALTVYGIHVAPIKPIPLGWVTMFAVVNTGTVAMLIVSVILTYHTAVDRAETALEAEYAKSEALLHNIMPPAVAARLKENPEVIADSHKPVTILFADIVGFTDMASRSSPDALVRLLNNIFSRFDTLVEGAGLEKIKTIGDAYMVVAGLPEGREDHAQAIARLALHMMTATEAAARETGERLQIRVGIHSGDVIAGVIGQRKFAYDIWGDTVNVAARMESTGIAGRIQITPDTAELLRDEFELEARGEIEVKGKGMMETFFLTRENAAMQATA
jgi:class 3 adenylate cyclase